MPNIPLPEPAYIKPPHPNLRWFEYAHLPERLRFVSAHFKNLAGFIDNNLPDGTQKDLALLGLLISKDAAIRAALDLTLETQDESRKQSTNAEDEEPTPTG